MASKTMSQDNMESRRLNLLTLEPRLLWIVLPATPTQRPPRQYRHRVERLLYLATAQLNGHRHLVLEANSRNQRVWEYEALEQWLHFTKDSGKLRTRVIRICSIMKTTTNPLQGAIRLETTIPLHDQDGVCKCSIPEKRHTPQSRRGENTTAALQARTLTATGLARLLLYRLPPSEANTGRRARPELSSHLHETAQQTSTTSHQSPTTANDQITYQTTQPLSLQAYPTDAAMKAKAKHKLLQQLDPTHATHKPVKKAQTVEQVFDDCGEDMSSILLALNTLTGTTDYHQYNDDPIDDLCPVFLSRINIVHGL